MHRVRFRDPDGAVRGGEWRDDERAIHARPGPTGRVAFPDDVFSPEEVQILAPAEPTKIVCIGLNYLDHAEEQGQEIPDRPQLFLKGPNAVAHHHQEVELLPGKERIDYEAELGVVIGERCKDVSGEEAMECVAGFTCVNDLSNRDDQAVEQNWVRAKAFDNAAPMGPALATPDEVPEDASIELRLNGETRQSSSRDRMAFSVPDLLEEITDYLTLEPGDVISTGTPAGVGRLTDGDRVEIEIEGIGTLENRVSIP